jgi:hypothetical protein
MEPSAGVCNLKKISIYRNNVTSADRASCKQLVVSHDSSVNKATGYGLNNRGSIPVRDRDYSLRHHTQPAIQLASWALSPEVRWLGREIDHFPQSTGIFTSTPTIHVHGVMLRHMRCILTFVRLYNYHIETWGTFLNTFFNCFAT